MRRSLSFFAIIPSIFAAVPHCAAHAAQQVVSQQIYAGSLLNGWTNRSTSPVDFSSKDYVYTSASSIKVTYTAAGQQFTLHNSGISTIGYANLTFWINGGATNGRNLLIGGIAGGGGQGFLQVDKYITGGSVAANTWRQVTVPLAAIGLGNTNMTGFFIVNNSGVQAPYYLDNIAVSAPPPPPQKVTVDFAASKHAINPLIYGVAYATQAQLADLNAPLNRWGGNATSRYNWLQNASNHASDWYFESIAGASSTPGADADSFVSTTQAASAQAMMTLPTLGWVAKLGPNRAKTWSFSQAKYGAQTASEGDAGNGILTNGQNVVGNDPTDANQTADSLFAQTWVQHFTQTFGTAGKGGLSYYLLDNEPSLWHSTHRDVHPVGARMSEIAAKTEDYAAKIKAADPNALVVGPEEWGWSGYFYSGYDQQYAAAHGWSNLPDRAANGNQDYLPWLLSTLHTYDGAHKTKSLDVLSVHYYPQGGEFSNDVSTAMQQRRNRSTRSLWDPTYVDETWIGTQVQLIPRLKGWVSSNYAGLKTALTEYNWGAEGSINGATTQADIYGIFGREGLDMATRWTTPDASTPTYLAMKMYRNVDGNNHGFGEVSVSDVVSDADTLSSFASVRSSDGAQTIMVINKALTGPTAATVTLWNTSVGGPLQAWQLTASNVITRLTDTNLSDSASLTLNLTFPAQSVTLFILPVKVPIPVAPIGLMATPSNAQVTLNWTASSGASSYNVKRSIKKGGPYTKIGTAPSAPTSYVDTNVTNGTTYYYVVSAVNVSGESANSNEANATPMAPVSPDGITGLFNTGVDNKNVPAADSSSDAHYMITNTPKGGNGNAYVTLPYYPLVPGRWLADSSTSKWISPEAYEAQQTDLSGNYTYQTTFTVTGDPTKVSITGRIMGDDHIAAIILNGKTIVSNLSSGYTAWASLNISSGFVSGTNTLQFVVYNTFNIWGLSGTSPTGFRCEMTPVIK